MPCRRPQTFGPAPPHRVPQRRAHGGRDRRFHQRGAAHAGDRARSRRRLDAGDFEPASADTPVIADLLPGGRYTAVELFGAGGVARDAQELIAAGMLEDTSTVTGKSLFEET